MGGKLVVEAIRAAGFAVIHHDERFAPDAPDEEWLTEAGRQGWIVVTRDRMIRRRQNELAALRAGKVVAFVVAAVNASGREVATIVGRLADKMARIATGTRAPSTYLIQRSGPPVKLPT